MKPCLGYPSRTAAILGLRRKQKTEREIADLLGIRPNTVTSIECRARRRGYGRWGKRPGALRVAGETYIDLAEEAERRGTTPGKLAVRLLRMIARDDLFAAVLDDALMPEGIAHPSPEGSTS